MARKEGKVWRTVLPDELSIADLYTGWQSALQRYAASLTQDMDSADDLVQETFIQAMAHLDLLSSLNPYQRRAWLYRVLKNRFIDQLRAVRRRTALLEQMADSLTGSPVPPPDAFRLDRMEDMPENYRTVIHKHYLLGMTSDEIGRELGLPSATIRSRLRLAIKWLRSRTDQLES